MPLLAQLNLPIITFTSFVNDILLNPSTPHRHESLVIRFGSEAGGIIVTSLTPEGTTYHHLFTQKKGAPTASPLLSFCAHYLYHTHTLSLDRSLSMSLSLSQFSLSFS